MTTLADIFQTGNRAALTVWLNNPHADLTPPAREHMMWAGPAEDSLGHDICAAFWKSNRWRVVDVLNHALQRLVEQPNMAHFDTMFSAIIAYAQSPQADITAQDGRDLLWELDDWEQQRVFYCQSPIFAPLYDLLGRITPLAQAIDHVQERFDRYSGDTTQIAYLLAIYGTEAIPPLQALLRWVVEDQMLMDLTTLEKRLCRYLAQASGHRLLTLAGLIQDAHWRTNAPHVLQITLFDLLPKEESFAP